MLTELVITIAVIVLLPIIFGVVFLARVWEERKMRINESFCIRLPKLITVFFAVFGAMFFLGMIGVLIGYCLDDSMPLSYFLLAEGLILFRVSRRAVQTVFRGISRGGERRRLKGKGREMKASPAPVFFRKRFAHPTAVGCGFYSPALKL